jgi:hypothetical protein
MEFVCDSDVMQVLEFMQSNMPTDKLVSVAKGVAQLAPILWGRYGENPVAALQLEHPISELRHGFTGNQERPFNRPLRRRV